ncbi:MAG TPA: amino acid ABC transporter substrate-binding protein [Ruminococcus sp.]|nr:amino acid ABC transporter substrate-binding protein [Ruminococcus sp.]
MKCKMKSILSVLALFCCVSMTACGGANTSTAPATSPTPATQPPAPEENTPDGEPADDNSWEKVQKKGEFIMGLDSDFPPLGFTDDSGKIVGFEVDLADEICKRLNISLVTHEIVWEEKEDDLSLGTIDCIWSGMSVTPERERTMCLSEPYMGNNIVFIVPADSEIHSVADVGGKTIGAQDGSTSEELLEKEYNSKVYITPLADNNELFRQLKLGLLDGVCVDSVVANYWNSNNGGNYTVLNATEDSEKYAIGFRKADVSLRNKIQETMDSMIADGTFTGISMKWFGTDVYARMNETADNSGIEGESLGSEEADPSEDNTGDDEITEE